MGRPLWCRRRCTDQRQAIHVRQTDVHNGQVKVIEQEHFLRFAATAAGFDVVTLLTQQVDEGPAQLSVVFNYVGSASAPIMRVGPALSVRGSST